MLAANRHARIGAITAVMAALLLVGAPHLEGRGAQLQGRVGRDATLLGSWRIVRGARAPWLARDARADTVRWRGERVTFGARRVQGPPPLRCGAVGYQRRELEAAGLFQGNLPTPADHAARAVGIRTLPVPSVLVDCDAGSFDFHLVASDTVVVALDNVIWTLVRAGRAQR